MLDKEEERRLELLTSIIRKEDWHDLATSSFLWLATRLKELNEELKALGSCSGDERHRHWSIDSRVYFWHSHNHEQRNSIDFNSLHHHPPEDHRKNVSS